ncbi:MAG: flagellar basal body P-ring formation protein FlgA [Nitrospinae bacterium]|nr:flagellar basal body P-ring formation protein FlgA [Nitrospinota bacterium]
MVCLTLLLAMLAAGPGRAVERGAISAAPDAKTSAFFQKAVGEYLASALSDTVSEYRVLDISVSGNEKIPAAFDDYRLNVQRTSKGMETVIGEVEFYSNGNEIKRISLSAKVEIQAEVAVAAERIPKGTTITEGMLRMEKIKVHGPVNDFCTDFAQVVGQVADRNIQPNRPVAKANLAKAVDVKAGDLILLVAENSEVKLTTRGVAKKDGSIGELIPVLNLRSNKRLFGRVVDAGTVQVNF